MIVNPGEFKHPIEIKRYEDYEDEDNILRKKWITLFSTRAKIINVHGEEFIQAEAADLKIRKTFYIRVNPNYKISEEDRIYYNGTYYNITYVNNIKEENYIYEIKCEVIK